LNVLFLLLITGQPDTLVLDFEDALGRAYQTAPDVRLSAVAIEEKSLEQEKVLSEFFPKITAQSQALRLDKAPSFKLGTIDIPLGDENIDLIQTGIQIPIWTFGRRLQGYALAGEAVELARLDSAEVARNLRMNVAELCLNIEFLSEAESLTEAAARNAQRHRLNIEDKYNQGLVSHYDLLGAKTKESALGPELTDIRNQRSALLTRLEILLNLGEDTVLVLRHDKWEQAEDSTPPIPYLDEVLSERPLWRELDLGQKMIDRQIKIKQREALPVVALGANYTVQRSPLTDTAWGTGWSYSIGAEIPISSGFSNYTEVKRLQKEKMKLAIQEDAMRAQVRFEVEEARGLLETAIARKQAAQDKENEALELVSIVQKRYKQGLASDVDLLDAELGLRKAKVDRISADKDVIVAQERWLKVIGGKT
jgi:outer membrane protein